MVGEGEGGYGHVINEVTVGLTNNKRSDGVFGKGE